MSVIATAVKHLLAAGVTGDALVAAIADMEASMDTRSSAAKRQARYRDNLDKKASQTVTNRNSNACENGAKEKSPQTPLKENKPLSPKGDTPPFDFRAEWNEAAKASGLRLCQAMNPSRMAQLRQRLAEHGPDGIRRAIAAAAASDFCRGENQRGWRAGPSFVLQAESCLRLIEGQYANKPEALDCANGSFLAHLTGQRRVTA